MNILNVDLIKISEQFNTQNQNNNNVMNVFIN